jgi:hypothetical protein
MAQIPTGQCSRGLFALREGNLPYIAIKELIISFRMHIESSDEKC